MTTEKLEKLRQQRAALEAKIRRELGREKSLHRREDTRRKILAGAAVLEEAKRNPGFTQTLTPVLERFLSRPDDRALFELPPLPQTPGPSGGRSR
jgi:hypothetical protein